MGNKSAKLPSFQFYPGDWRKDPGVQALNLYTRGLWFEILLLMHESEQRGRLLLNGKPMPEEALARLLGIGIEELITALTTLLDYGVASRDEQGALINRRMIRDEQDRVTQAEYGKEGGNPALTGNYNKPGFVYAVQRASDGWIKIGISENPTKRVYKIRYQEKGDNVEMLGFRHFEDMSKAQAGILVKFNKVKNINGWLNLNGEQQGQLKSTLEVTLLEKAKGKSKGKSKGKQTPSSSSSSSSSVSSSARTEAAAASTNLSETESFDDYLIRKQIEYPHLDVKKIYEKFRKLCGSVNYPRLSATKESFDSWLLKERPEFPPLVESPSDDVAAEGKPQWQIDRENCSFCDDKGLREVDGARTRCNHKPIEREVAV